MKLTLQQVFDVTPVIATIIREKRVLPFKGSYRMMRAHAKLAPELKIVGDKYDEFLKLHAKAIEGQEGQFTMTPEFVAAWTDFAKDEIEITDLDPIPLEQLDPGDGVVGLFAADLIALGPLVKDD